MMQNTYKNSNGVSCITQGCLKVISGDYLEINNNRHYILYTNHLITYIYMVTCTRTHTCNFIREYILPCVDNLKKVIRCLVCILISKMVITTNHLVSTDNDCKVITILDSVRGVRLFH